MTIGEIHLINQHQLHEWGWWGAQRGGLDPRNTAEGPGMPRKVPVTYLRMRLVNELCAHPAVSLY